MYATTVYIYKPRQQVIVYSGNSPRKFQQMYANNLKLHRGVDNKIQFRFLNQEQKPIDVSDREITCRILDSTNSQVILQKTLSEFLPVTGIMELEVLSSDLVDIKPQNCFYSLSIADGDGVYPVFVDTLGGSKGKIEIMDDILPTHIESNLVGIPSTSGVIYYSSEFSPDKFSTTIQVTLTGYSGNIVVEGSVNSATWYTVTQVSLVASDGAIISIDGFHPKVRVKFQPTQGEPTRILYR